MGSLCLCDTVTSYFHHVIQDKGTRPTGTICSVNARLLSIYIYFVGNNYIQSSTVITPIYNTISGKIPTTIAFLSSK